MSPPGSRQAHYRSWHVLLRHFSLSFWTDLQNFWSELQNRSKQRRFYHLSKTHQDSETPNGPQGSKSRMGSRQTTGHLDRTDEALASGGRGKVRWEWLQRATRIAAFGWTIQLQNFTSCKLDQVGSSQPADAAALRILQGGGCGRFWWRACRRLSAPWGNWCPGNGAAFLHWRWSIKSMQAFWIWYWYDLHWFTVWCGDVALQLNLKPRR